MICNGTVINQGNYDSIHGAGSWNTYIGSSPLDGKYTPNLRNRYIVGRSGDDLTSQSGASAFTYTGQTGHTIDLAHAHSDPSHVHQWYNYVDRVEDAQTYDSNGSAVTLPTGLQNYEDKKFLKVFSADSSSQYGLNDSYTTSNNGGVTGNPLSSTQTVKPESLEVLYYIRII